MTPKPHPAQALLDEQQQLNNWERHIYLRERAQLLVLKNELRAMQAAIREVQQ